jgi:hypothetical protein
VRHDRIYQWSDRYLAGKFKQSLINSETNVWSDETFQVKAKTPEIVRYCKAIQRSAELFQLPCGDS